MSDPSTSLLLNIITQLGELQGSVGRINAQLEAGAERHREFQQKLDILDHRTDIIEDKAIELVSILKPDDGPSLVSRVKSLENFVGKVGAIISMGAVVLSSLVWFIWTTLVWVWDHMPSLRSFMHSLFR